MASYESITFQPSLFKEKMLVICDDALDEAVDVIRGNEYFANGEITYLPEHNEFDGYVEISASDLKAWLVEYGTGEFMRKDNPYLDEYKRSPYYFNLRRYRNDDIVFRGKQKYTQLDYESGSGEVTREGSNPAGKVINKGTPAQPFLQQLIEEAYKAFENSLYTKLSTFDISSCFYKSTNNI